MMNLIDLTQLVMTWIHQRQSCAPRPGAGGVPFGDTDIYVLAPPRG
jgi:hypothetical protein